MKWIIYFTDGKDTFYYSGKPAITNYLHKSLEINDDEIIDHSLAVDEYKEILLDKSYNENIQVYIQRIVDGTLIPVSEIKIKKIMSIL